MKCKNTLLYSNPKMWKDSEKIVPYSLLDSVLRKLLCFSCWWHSQLSDISMSLFLQLPGRKLSEWWGCQPLRCCWWKSTLSWFESFLYLGWAKLSGKQSISLWSVLLSLQACTTSKFSEVVSVLLRPAVPHQLSMLHKAPGLRIHSP